MVMGVDLVCCWCDGWFDSQCVVQIDVMLLVLMVVVVSCECIKNMLLLFLYMLLLYCMVYFYCFLLFFGVVDMLGLMMFFVVVIVVYIFFGLDVLGDEIEEFFGSQVNDLLLDVICCGIEIDVWQVLGDVDLLLVLELVDYLLI